MDNLITSRLVLRDWREADRAPFAALNADPEVMRYFPSTLTRVESDLVVERIAAGHADDGFGLWAVEVPGVADFIGFIGIMRPAFDAPFTPAVEIGWRLASQYWGHGYAPEGARAALQFAFDQVGLDEIVSMTTHTNLRSQRVMQKLGMSNDPLDNFDHPNVPLGHPLRPHVLYRLNRAGWSGRSRDVLA